MNKALNIFIILVLAIFSLFVPMGGFSQDHITTYSTSKEHIFHKLNNDTQDYKVSSVVTIDEDGTPSMCQTFTYDEKGRLASKSLYGNLSGTSTHPIVIDHEGLPQDNGVERFTLYWTYDEEGLIKEQHFTSNDETEIDDHNFRSLTRKGKFWDRFMHTVFGQGFLQFAGYYEGTTGAGIFKEGNDVHDKVRVSVINGILNIPTDIEAILNCLSSTHGDVTVHYVYRPTEGWTRDIWNCAFVKMGFLSEPARHLGALWKKLIAEMGGTEGGGVIRHYAHSIGATDTYNALDLLNDKEKKMIHVVTIGSPSMIPANAGFASVVNYASKRDAICMLDPLGYIRALTSADTNVIFVGSSFGPPEHTIYTESYQNVLRELGSIFNETYR